MSLKDLHTEDVTTPRGVTIEELYVEMLLRMLLVYLLLFAYLLNCHFACCC